MDELQADGTFGVLEDFVDSIRTGKRPVTTAADGLRATRLAQAILEVASAAASPQELAA